MRQNEHRKEPSTRGAGREFERHLEINPLLGVEPAGEWTTWPSAKESLSSLPKFKTMKTGEGGSFTREVDLSFDRSG